MFYLHAEVIIEFQNEKYYIASVPEELIFFTDGINLIKYMSLKLKLLPK